ncbi:hypothetical protein LZ32DRAFT_107910 [Colletotrichum eremochloae]|nr:hypothetical protein LZ32DRAFT_107910 [Colletotrichum eremochloae]
MPPPPPLFFFFLSSSPCRQNTRAESGKAVRRSTEEWEDLSCEKASTAELHHCTTRFGSCLWLLESASQRPLAPRVIYVCTGRMVLGTLAAPRRLHLQTCSLKLVHELD